MTAFLCGAVKTAVEALHWPDAPDIVWGTVGALRDRVLAGERPSVIVVSDVALEVLAATGIVATERIVRLGRAGTGVAVSMRDTGRLPPPPNPLPRGEGKSPSPLAGGLG
jgi:hypothetical protein